MADSRKNKSEYQPVPEGVESIAVIVPVLNEAGRCEHLIKMLRDYRRQSQIVIVDGGSRDDTVRQLTQAGFAVLQTEPCRALQMNYGYSHLEADAYWFLHADCTPPHNAMELIRDHLDQGYGWGRFDVRLSGSNLIFRIIERMMNWRSCLTQVATGDQGIFIRGSLLRQIGGIPDISIMEDIALSKMLRSHGRCACVSDRMLVSSRRWEKNGIIYMTMLMWWLRLRYFMGADPQDLHRWYYGQSK